MQGNLLKQGKILIHILPELHNLRDLFVSYIKLVRAKWGRGSLIPPLPINLKLFYLIKKTYMYFNLTYVRISTYRCISVHDTYSSTTTHCSNNGKKYKKEITCMSNTKINALKNSLL